MTENASVITLPWGYKPPATFRLFDSYCIPEESVFEFTEEMVSELYRCAQLSSELDEKMDALRAQVQR